MWQQVFLHSLTSSRSPASSKWHKLFHTCVWNQSTSKIYNRDVCRHTIQTVHQAKYFAKKACPLSKCYSTCSTHNEEDVRKNELGIQMLTKTLRDQIFAQTKDIRHTEGLNAKKLVEIETHLKKFDLWDKTTELLPDVDLKLPGLRGSNIDEHFRELAERQTAKYVKEADRLASCELPPMPKKWVKREGWTRYGQDGSITSVDFPEDVGLVFDIEVVVPEGNCPTMATAASSEAWYSWCSERLIQQRFYWSPKLHAPDLIPLETAAGSTAPPDGTWHQRLVVGHNVGFDRTFVKEQYYIKGSKIRFLDTMSMHIATSGLTSFQRMMYVAKRSGSKRKEVKEMLSNTYGNQESPMELDWIERSSLNSLKEVYQLYVGGEPLKKEARDVFVNGTMEEIREDFQNLMAYCANDVKATHDIFKKLWPEFTSRFPHPVTLGGMLEMSTAYLPVNSSWLRYIDASQAVYTALQHELKVTLMGLANTACELLHNKRYKDDVWLWDMDWSVKNLRTKMPPKNMQSKSMEKQTAEDHIQQVLELAKANTPAKPAYMPCYPRWYAELCPRDSELGPEVTPGPSKISTLKRVTPKLLKLTWQGYPLHYSSELGWGYLIPGKADTGEDELTQELDSQDDGVTSGELQEATFPLKSLYEVAQPTLRQELSRITMTEEQCQLIWDKLEQSGYNEEAASDLWRQLAASGMWQPTTKKNGPSSVSGPSFHQGHGPFESDVPGCWFFKLPHKDGYGSSTGNPLSKDHLTNIERGHLKANCGTHVDNVLRQHIMCAYWKNNEKRIRSQMVVQLSAKDLPTCVTSNPNYDEESFYGAILPRVIAAGTVTRRAVEATWLTASNARRDRVGSELKAMIQSPPGYSFVGADVDSQELWIAAILGDANFAGIHGCTAFGWMTLLGNKSDGTDLHSRIAAQVGISRDQAKIFNYGRIYGAGKKFAEQLLQQFNPDMLQSEAKKKARMLYTYSKGKRKKFMDRSSDPEEDEAFGYHYQWEGGTESHMFNKLESVATVPQPQTPVLGCTISKSLEPKNVGTYFMTSRVNWVVQSSAVDYLHLMLVSMRWLIDDFDIDGRFSISIHDEVRYLVASKDAYRAALALQITNLLVRCMFAYKLGMQDLPQAVAFFSSVDIDTCLRKEVDMDCKTPSNPRGLQNGCNIPTGEALTIHAILEKTGGSLAPEDTPVSGEL